ncbi:MAG: DUF4258 domain-containing protein [Candidatus Coatesbacteria bacterium]|nr:DUF4258 domain-containing protein [Candidatus Coatesbacteria bacterium]
MVFNQDAANFLPIMPMQIDWIRERVSRSEYLLTSHAEIERRNDDVDLVDIEEALLSGVVIEDYPDDPRGSSCLVCGFSSGKAIHIVCGRNSIDWLVLITVYIPSMHKWEDPHSRRRQ